MKHVVTRMLKPTPVFFKKIRNIGLALAAVLEELHHDDQGQETGR